MSDTDPDLRPTAYRGRHRRPARMRRLVTATTAAALTVAVPATIWLIIRHCPSRQSVGIAVVAGLLATGLLLLTRNRVNPTPEQEPLTMNPPTTKPVTVHGGSDAGVAAAAWTGERIRRLGTVTDIGTAAAIFGLARSTAYELARAGTFPVPVLRFGSRYRVPVAAILTALHLPTGAPEPATAPDLTGAGVHGSIDPPQSAAPPGPYQPPRYEGTR